MSLNSLYCEKCYKAAELAKQEADLFGYTLKGDCITLDMFLTRDRSECGCPKQLPEEFEPSILTDAEAAWFQEAWDHYQAEKQEQERLAGIALEPVPVAIPPADTTSTGSEFVHESLDVDMMKNEDKENVTPMEMKTGGSQKNHQKTAKGEKKNRKRRRQYVSKMNEEKRQRYEKERGDSESEAKVLEILEAASAEIVRQQEDEYIYSIRGFDD